MFIRDFFRLDERIENIFENRTATRSGSLVSKSVRTSVKVMEFPFCLFRAKSTSISRSVGEKDDEENL